MGKTGLWCSQPSDRGWLKKDKNDVIVKCYRSTLHNQREKWHHRNAHISVTLITNYTELQVRQPTDINSLKRWENVNGHYISLFSITHCELTNVINNNEVIGNKIKSEVILNSLTQQILYYEKFTMDSNSPTNVELCDSVTFSPQTQMGRPLCAALVCNYHFKYFNIQVSILAW